MALSAQRPAAELDFTAAAEQASAAAGTAAERARRCKFPPTERSFNTIIQGLFNEGLVPAGDVLDAGAHRGHWACLYACYQPFRYVRALDPTPSKIANMECNTGRPHRLHKYVRAISNASGSIYVEDSPGLWGHGRGSYASADNVVAPKNSSKFVVRVNTSSLDDLFLREWRSRLGFAHLDLEGHELHALEGGWRTIQRDLPIISTEVSSSRSFRQRNERARAAARREAQLAGPLLAKLRSLGYVSFMVMEVTGVYWHRRNVLSLPLARLPQMMGSPTLDLAARGLLMVPVNETTLGLQVCAPRLQRTPTLPPPDLPLTDCVADPAAWGQRARAFVV